MIISLIRPVFVGLLALTLSQSAFCTDLMDKAPGSTDFRLSLDTDGRVISCEIMSSSEDGLTEAQVCQFMKTRARFYAPIEDGKPIASVYANRLQFKVGKKFKVEVQNFGTSTDVDRHIDTIVGTYKLLAAGVRRFLTAHVLIAPDGKVEKCSIYKSSNDADLDDLACSALKSNHVRPAVDKNNNPVRSVWDMRIMVQGFGTEAR